MFDTKLLFLKQNFFYMIQKFLSNNIFNADVMVFRTQYFRLFGPSEQIKFKQSISKILGLSKKVLSRFTRVFRELEFENMGFKENLRIAHYAKNVSKS